MKDDCMIALEGVTRTFRSPGEPDVEVLAGVDLTITRGDTVAIVGPSGSGKSTLLNIVGGLDRADSGTVRVEGQDLTSLGDRDLAELRNQTVGFVFQLHHLLPQCTVIENVLVPTLARGGRGDSDALRERAESLLERTNLMHRRDAFPATLSGGERQRVAVARALINAPRLLLADEPTGALDAASADALADLLVELNREEETTLVLVTHSHDLAQRMATQLRLCNGTLQPLTEEER